jgi:enamine deaminase RidA (YjgF/YER057c/UK114 family)
MPSHTQFLKSAEVAQAPGYSQAVAVSGGKMIFVSGQAGLDKQRLQILRSVRDTYVDKDHPPVSTLAGVQTLFRDDCLIEIEAVAVVP